MLSEGISYLVEMLLLLLSMDIKFLYVLVVIVLLKTLQLVSLDLEHIIKFHFSLAWILKSPCWDVLSRL